MVFVRTVGCSAEIGRRDGTVISVPDEPVYLMPSPLISGHALHLQGCRKKMSHSKLVMVELMIGDSVLDQGFMIATRSLVDKTHVYDHLSIS